MMATGSFEVKAIPAEASAFEKEAGVARYTLEKTFTGGMEGAAQGEMLSSFTESTGAMAYVAMDHVTAWLGDRSGSFYFAHTATMTKGDASSGVMKVVVVKNSGTDGLAGISGELEITVDGAGKHLYSFEYELPE